MKMAQVLPSTVEELNFLQQSLELPTTDHTNMYVKEPNKGFENIFVEKRYKREVSLPNGVQNWNISNFDPYLNFEDNVQANNFEAAHSTQDDGVVPEEGDFRQRCSSLSSVSSNMDDKYLVYQSVGLKTFSTVHMDSGSTCISSDHTYVNSVPLLKGLDVEETYQNLDAFFKQGPELHTTDSIQSVSPIGSPINDSLDYSALGNSYSTISASCSQDSFEDHHPISLKRTSDTPVEELLFIGASKRICDSPNAMHYMENRKKNNISAKNCRKTRKEKQKEMEAEVLRLEKEKEQLRVQVHLLETLIEEHKHKLYAILQNR